MQSSQRVRGPNLLSETPRWASVSIGGGSRTCGIEEESRRLHCWGATHFGSSDWKTASRETFFKERGFKDPSKVRWLMVSAGNSWSGCGIVETSRRLYCWGADHDLTNTGWVRPKNKCKAAYKCLGLSEKTRWISVSVADRTVCGVTEASNKPVCWGQVNSQLSVPTKGIQWDLEKSCQIQHPSIAGPASCTMCHKGCSHTIMDPKRNACTCTTKPCPMCKPKSCCGKHHKHYIYNTESMEGVCVRHNDDCTAVCAPQEADPNKRRVCSKGCNRKLKVSKLKPKKGATTDEDLFDIIVCQVDHRIVCEPWRRSSGGSNALGRRLLGKRGDSQASPCKTMKSVVPVARCTDFDSDVWNAGATCIANLAHHDKHPQCDRVAKSALSKVRKCRRPRATEQLSATERHVSRWRKRWPSIIDTGNAAGCT